MASTISLRIDSNLVIMAEREARVENRSRAKQIEYWAKLGKAVSSKLNLADAFAVNQGLKEIKLQVPETVDSIAVDPGDVFDDLEQDRKNGTLKEKVTSATIYFEVSPTKKGLLDRVDLSEGTRKTGQFENGKFREI